MTHGGCGALCPGFDRGCFGCFGPADTVNVDALVARLRRTTKARDITRKLHTFTTEAPGFRGTTAEEQEATP